MVTFDQIDKTIQLAVMLFAAQVEATKMIRISNRRTNLIFLKEAKN
jgi:hypothetical protein